MSELDAEADADPMEKVIELAGFVPSACVHVGAHHFRRLRKIIADAER